MKIITNLFIKLIMSASNKFNSTYSFNQTSDKLMQGIQLNNKTQNKEFF